MNTESELALTQQRLADLELRSALQGWDPAAEARIGRPGPSVAGQSPANSRQIEAAMRSVDAAQQAVEERERANAPSQEEAIRALQAAQVPENHALIRASAATPGNAGPIRGPAVAR